MSRKTLLSVLLVVVIIAIAAASFFVFGRKKLDVIRIDADRTIEGDFAVAPGQQVVLAKGAKLTVTGNMSVDGELVCEGGAVQATVGGEFRVSNKIACPDVNQKVGIAISAKTFRFEKTATVVSAGSVQLVDRADKILVAEKLEQAFQEVEKDTGTGLRVGPFGTGTGLRSSANKAEKTAWLPEGIVHTAAAAVLGAEPVSAAPTTRISGNWQIVGEGEIPPERIKVQKQKKSVQNILLNFDFGPGNDIVLQDLTISGPNGDPGEPDTNTCTALGKNGKDAMRMNVRADNLIVNNFTLHLGNGGDGGGAVTKEDCESAFATGGNGGKPGNFKMVATGSFEIRGSFEVFPGRGGDGGLAIATGKEQPASCDAKKGGDATAKGGKGADALESLKVSGTVGGLANVNVHEINGGVGGNAVAQGGRGSTGDKCGCNGGNGGKSSATGGQGGSVAGSTLTNTASAFGGNGGDSDSWAGNGGSGGSCGPDKKGGNGGNGGAADAKPGKAGTGPTGNGVDGDKTNQKGGNGGNGGDGCGPGNGGAGGSGDPAGQPGKKGKNTCLIDVIQYQGKYIPTSQVHLASPDACKEQHWHGTPAKALDGTVFTDPNPSGCGYCTLSQCPVLKVPAPEITVDTSATIEIRGGIFGN